MASVLLRSSTKSTDAPFAFSVETSRTHIEKEHDSSQFEHSFQKILQYCKLGTHSRLLTNLSTYFSRSFIGINHTSRKTEHYTRELTRLRASGICRNLANPGSDGTIPTGQLYKDRAQSTKDILPVRTELSKKELPFHTDCADWVAGEILRYVPTKSDWIISSVTAGRLYRHYIVLLPNTYKPELCDYRDDRSTAACYVVTSHPPDNFLMRFLSILPLPGGYTLSSGDIPLIQAEGYVDGTGVNWHVFSWYKHSKLGVGPVQPIPTRLIKHLIPHDPSIRSRLDNDSFRRVLEELNAYLRRGGRP